MQEVQDRQGVFNPILYHPQEAREPSPAVIQLTRTISELKPWAKAEIIEVIDAVKRCLRESHDPSYESDCNLYWEETGRDPAMVKYAGWQKFNVLSRSDLARGRTASVVSMVCLLDHFVRYDDQPKHAVLRTATETWAAKRGNCIESGLLVGATLDAMGIEHRYLLTQNPVGFNTKKLPIIAAFHPFALFDIDDATFIADKSYFMAAKGLDGMCSSYSVLTPWQYASHAIAFGAGRSASRGEYDNTREYFKVALLIDPRNYTHHTGLGEIAALCGDHQEFFRQFSLARAIAPSCGDIDKTQGDVALDYLYDAALARRSYRAASRKGCTDVLVAYDLLRRSETLDDKRLTRAAARAVRSFGKDPRVSRYLVAALVSESASLQDCEDESPDACLRSLRSAYKPILDLVAPGVWGDFCSTRSRRPWSRRARSPEGLSGRSRDPRP